MKGADFILFWHGFTLLLIGTALFLRRREAVEGYNRLYISMFCFLMGLGEWTGVFSLSAGAEYKLHLLRFLFFISAFIFLFEAARTSAVNAARWLLFYPVCAIITGIAVVSGMDPLLASQYAVAVPSLIFIASVLHRRLAGADNPAAYTGPVPQIGYMYALLWLIPAPGCRVPFFSGHQVLDYLVFAAAIMRAFCITSGLALLMVKRYDYFFKVARSAGRVWLTVVTTGILAAAFAFSTLFAKITGSDMRSSITGMARAIAMGINPDRINDLAFTAEDKTSPSFIRIREQMKAWGRYTGLRSIYSMEMKEGRFYFGPESIEENDPMASPPGTEYLQPPRAFIDAWISGQSGVTGPYTDEYGSFISGYAPVFDRMSGRVLMIAAVDYDMKLWDYGILKGRARGFIPAMIVVFCLLFWLVMFDQRMVSRSERRSFFSRNMESVCCLATGIIITCIISFYMNYFEKRIEAKEFYNQADSWSNILRSVITESRYQTEDLSLYLENSEEVSWAEFRGFYSGRNIFPYVSIGWYPRVKAAERHVFESYMRGQGFSDYRITGAADAKGPGGSVFYPLAYIVPIEYGKKELGRDISGTPEVRDALDTGLLTMLDRNKEEADSASDIVLINPVSRHGKNIGFVRSVVDLKLLLSRVLSFRNSINPGVMVDIADIGSDGSAGILMSYPDFHPEGSVVKDESGLYSVYPVFYSGHTLCIKLYRTADFMESRMRTAGPVSFVLGMFFSVAVSLLVAYLIYRRNSLEGEIEQRTSELRENEDRYRIISEFTGQLVYGWDVDTDTIHWSGRIEEITGFMPETFNSTGFEGWKMLVHPDDRDRVQTMLEAAKKTGGTFQCEYRFKKADGSYMIVEDNGAFLFYGSDTPVSMLGVIKDITKRRKVEDELRESEERFRTLHNASFGGISIHDGGIIVICNRGLSEMTGYAIEELTGMNSLLLIAPAWRDFVREKITSGYEKSYDVEGIRKDGSVYPLEINGRNIPYKGRPMRVTEFRDITERKSILLQLEKQKQELEAGIIRQQAQMTEFEAVNAELREVNKRLAESDEKFSRAFRINPAIIVISRLADGVLVDVNDMFFSATGYSRDEVIGRTMEELELFQDYSQRTTVIDLVKKNGIVKNFEISIRTNSGEIRFGLLSADIISLKGADYVLGVINDITERKHLESAMMESEKKYRMLFEFSLDAMFIVEEYFFIDCNETALKMFKCSREDIIGATPFDFSPLDQPAGGRSEKLALEKLNAAYAGRPQLFNWIHRTRDGTEFEAEVFMGRLELGDRMYVMAGVRDITERRRYEARLNHMQKMEAIGQIAGGIAHDFNNQLSGIMGYAELLSMKLKEESLKKYSDGIMSVAARASELTRRLLNFSRKTGIQEVPCDLHRIITDTIEILRHSIDKRITLAFKPDASKFTVMGDPSELQNSLLNLGLNARDAMDRSGVLTFSTFNTRLMPEDSAGHLMSVSPGEYIVVCVTDTGTGMSEDVKSHLFEPFFTTKTEGKGTGMGLASVYASVKNHHGTISVNSEAGRGTEFKIYLPLGGGSALNTASPDVGSSRISRQRILIVDDESVIRDILCELLEQEGHSVLEASDGNRALELYRHGWKEIDLVILDMVMPGMNGTDTFIEMKKINPGVRVIVTTGYTGGDQGKIFMDGAEGYVHKPFQKGELMRVVASVVTKDS